MLVIKPITDSTEQIEICGKCGIEYIEGHFAYKAHDDGTLIACAQFEIGSAGAEIDAIKQVIGTQDDFEAMFILGRAVLNFLDLCGIEKAYFPSVSSESEERLAKAIGFKYVDGVLEATLTHMFDAKCDGHCEG